MDNSAQAGGDTIFSAATIFTGLAGLVKNASKKITKLFAKNSDDIIEGAAKTVDNAVEHIDEATDAAKATRKIESQTDDAAKDGTKITKKKRTNHEGAAFGEKRSHEKMEELGYERIDKGGEYKPGTTGIDGVYKNSSPPPDYVVIEAKYNTAGLSTLKDGTKQMSDKWVKDRLVKAVGETETRKIVKGLTNGNTAKWLTHVDEAGNVTGKVLDAGAKTVKGITPF